MPKLDAAALGSDVLPRLDGTAGDNDGLWQRGGSVAACAALDGFLSTRGETYRSGMSSPLTGPDVCSRISPHLAHGTLSLSQVVAALGRRRTEVLAEPPSLSRSRWLASLKSFEGRLYWHCHFMQKLESDPRIEFENMVRGFDGLREADFSREHFERWSAGQTGYPLVDACMRMLVATGWLNFRMRAMLVSFAAFPLWLHWREPGLHLARLFTDYEPGIHWPQIQMQATQTGINTPRIYNVIKQGLDQDPDGAFTRRELPELASVPPAFLQEPWKMDAATQAAAGVRIGTDYPSPAVDHADAVRTARERLARLRAEPGYRAAAERVFLRHGSRKRRLDEDDPGKARALRAAKAEKRDLQLSLDLPGVEA
jgi:deoxyribodipyrimidine photo-lyase